MIGTLTPLYQFFFASLYNIEARTLSTPLPWERCEILRKFLGSCGHVVEACLPVVMGP